LERAYFQTVNVTAAELASDSESVLDRVISHGETVHVQREGRTVAEIRPSAGVSRDELLRILGEIRWTESESREFRKAMDAAAEVFGYAGRD
jgi:antitoxin (DNA-binding transcriptional repressor) of toxin-antitoxin stability system